jgi:hypothetical protein
MIRFTVLCLTVLAMVATAQELELPNGSVTRIASPDGTRILCGVPYQSGVNDSPQLWIEDTRTHSRKMLLSIPGTLYARWAPDGTAFSVSAGASDYAQAWIYDAVTLQRLDLGRLILAADPEAQRFGIGHAYFNPESWDDREHVIVRFHGHTDDAPIMRFDFRYRVSRAGSVEKLSQHVTDGLR